MNKPEAAVKMASRIEVWPLARLLPYDRNSRTHSPEQVEEIAHSIMQFGFTNPILVNESDGLILAGHARLAAAKMLKLESVPVVPLDHLSETERRAYIIADNKLALNAGWDEKVLRAELEDLKSDAFDLDVLGFTDAELKDLLNDSRDILEGETDPDEAPAEELEAVSRPGDVWVLGNHRLVVGDSRVSTTWERLMGSETADLVLTDPPYNCDYKKSQASRIRARVNGTREKEHDVIAQDATPPEEYAAFCDAVMVHVAAAMKKGASFYVFYALQRQTLWEQVFERCGFFVRCQLIWAKNHFVLTYNRYKQQHETIFYGHLKGQQDPWYGDNSQSTVWFEKRPNASREHPTMKPVELLERGVVNSSKRGDIVVDPFGGSGSTMIACERLGRKARLIEIEPVYGDVILRRWRNYTKQQPVLVNEGPERPFLQVERERVLLEAKKAAPAI